MKKVLRLPLALLVCGLISACGLMGGNGSADLTPAAQAAPAAKANAFNPWMNKSLPNTRTLSAEGMAMVQAMGADRQSIEDEAAYRPHWREEIYPVFFGNKTAPHELIVLLDFASPDSARVWQAVRDASAKLSPADAKIAVFAKNSENYGTDLMGMGIWISYERKGQAMDYMSHALSEWNRIKAAQKKQEPVRCRGYGWSAAKRLRRSESISNCSGRFSCDTHTRTPCWELPVVKSAMVAMP